MIRLVQKKDEDIIPEARTTDIENLSLSLSPSDRKILSSKNKNLLVKYSKKSCITIISCINSCKFSNSFLPQI